MMDKKRIAQLLEVLGKGLFEKEHVLSLSLLAAVAGGEYFPARPSRNSKEYDSPKTEIGFPGTVVLLNI